VSYILEALKKSQQARELGRVPTLETHPLFNEEPLRQNTVPWGVLSVGLAILAVLIALYAAFRAPGQAPRPAPLIEPTEVSRDPAPSVADGAVTALSTPEPTPPSAIVSPIEDPAELDPRALAADPAGPARSVEQPRSRVAPTAADSARSPSTDDDLDVVDDEDMAFESVLDPWLEQELLREMDAEQAMNAEPAPVARSRPQRAPVPPDLVEDIESFKQQLRREQGIPPPTVTGGPVDIKGDPTALRLTPQQQAQVPAYVMTVHVFDEDLSKRFVLINALRYVEGEETREGIRVERIIPEGAVLSYLGNPFFVRR
jgi:general secretion pathway protein B